MAYELNALDIILFMLFSFFLSYFPKIVSIKLSQAAVTDIQVVPHGFLSCGGDGIVKLVRLDNHLRAHGIEL